MQGGVFVAFVRMGNKRINQKELLKKEEVAEKIFEIHNSDVNSGELIRIDEGDINV